MLIILNMVGFTTTCFSFKWLTFQHGGKERSLDPVLYRSVLSFIPSLVYRGLVHATIKEYAVAIC